MARSPHGFFAARRQLEISSPDLSAPGLVEYPNVPRTIGAAISLKMASLQQLDTVYGVRDLYDLLEIASVDAHNRRMIEKQAIKEQQQQESMA